MIRSFRRQPEAPVGNGGNEADSDDEGPLVKRLRRGPLTPQTWVRFPHGSPIFLFCSAQNPLQMHISVLYYFGRQKAGKRTKSFVLFPSFWEVSRCL